MRPRVVGDSHFRHVHHELRCAEDEIIEVADGVCTRTMVGSRRPRRTSRGSHDQRPRCARCPTPGVALLQTRCAADRRENTVIEVSHEVDTSPDNVFAVLADGWSYAGWVVGNSHVREVDPGWPQVGTRIHHSAGAWPVQIPDSTEVVAVEPGRFLELDAKLRLFGAARIRFTLTPTYSGHGTRIVMAEEAVRGPGGLIPTQVQGLLLRPRNLESLARLGDLAVGREQLASDAEARTAR